MRNATFKELCPLHPGTTIEEPIGPAEELEIPAAPRQIDRTRLTAPVASQVSLGDLT